MRVPNNVRRVMDQAQELDNRRQHQIHNQIAAINRLAAALHHDAPWTYTDEMSALHQTLSAAQAATDAALERVRELEEELMGKRKDAFYAGFSAGETEDSVDEAWAEFKAEQDTAEPAADEDSTDDE